MQGTVQNYLHELTAWRLAVILQNLESSSSKNTFDYAWQLHPVNPTLIEHFHFQCVLFSAKYRWQPQKLANNKQYQERLMSLTSMTAEVPSVDKFEWRNRVSWPLPLIKFPWTNKPVFSIWRSSVHMYFSGENPDGYCICTSFKMAYILIWSVNGYLTFVGEIYCLLYYAHAVVLWL